VICPFEIFTMGRNLRGIRTPLFGLRDTVPPIFRMKKWRICCQQKRSAEIKLHNPTQHRERESSRWRSSRPRVEWDRIARALPFSSPAILGQKGTSFSFGVGTPGPRLFKTKVTPRFYKRREFYLDMVSCIALHAKKLLIEIIMLNDCSAYANLEFCHCDEHGR